MLLHRMSPKSLTPRVYGIACCKDADVPWVERVSFLIAHNYNAEPFKALIGKYCIHLELQRKYIGKQSVITQSGIGPRLEIHTPANSTRRFLMTIDEQASVSFLVQKAMFAAGPAFRCHGQGPVAQCGSTPELTELVFLYWSQPSSVPIKWDCACPETNANQPMTATSL